MAWVPVTVSVARLKMLVPTEPEDTPEIEYPPVTVVAPLAFKVVLVVV
jgi:hypothetical protein